MLSLRYKRDRRLFIESKDIVSGIVRTFSGRLQRQEELLRVLEGTMRHVVKTQEEHHARLERITEHMAQSMDLQRRLVGILAKVGGKVNRGLSRSVPKEESGMLEASTAEGYAAPMETALLKLNPTEMRVLQLLAIEGPLPSPRIGRTVGKSREHTARLMKKLYEQGYVDRETSRIPYRYKVNERIRDVLEKTERKETKEKAEQRAQEKEAA